MKQSDTLEIVREIRAKPEKVFRALTDPQELAKWWTGVGGIKQAKIDLRVGGAYSFEFRGHDGGTVVMHGEYRVVEPPRRFAMTWVSPEFPNLDTLVAFELEPVASGTRLTIRHSGLADPQAFKDHEEGWLAALALLITWLAVAGPALGLSGVGTTKER